MGDCKKEENAYFTFWFIITSHGICLRARLALSLQVTCGERIQILKGR